MENQNTNNIEVQNLEILPPTKPTARESVWDLAKFLLIALAIVLPIRFFVAQPFVVSGLSMYPTFNNGNYLIVDEISYKMHNPARGDVIIFHYPKDPTKYFIKRVIGLPGETVKIDGSTVSIKNSAHPDGFVLDEPYVKNKSSNQSQYVLGPDEYFMMGDNRSASSDSRIWGNLPKKLIVGRAFLRLYPLSDLNVLPGEYKPEGTN